MLRMAVLRIIVIVLAMAASWTGKTLPVAAEDTIRWSGFDWRVSSSAGRPRGPGPNIFSTTKQNVFVDDAARLHLKITQRGDEAWTASEVGLTESLGYGTYTWELSSRYDGLPSNVVVGLFTYLSPASVAKQTRGVVGNGKPDTPHEIDIEFTGAWGKENHFFTTHDPDVKSPGVRFQSKPRSDHSTHRFTWSPNKIVWESFEGHLSDHDDPSHLLTDQHPGPNSGESIRHVYEGPVIPKELNEHPMINFWMFKSGDEEPWMAGPAGGKPQELVIRSFKFTPL